LRRREREICVPWGWRRRERGFAWMMESPGRRPARAALERGWTWAMVLPERVRPEGARRGRRARAKSKNGISGRICRFCSRRAVFVVKRG
jgi:hypothetical protein